MTTRISKLSLFAIASWVSVFGVGIYWYFFDTDPCQNSLAREVPSISTHMNPGDPLTLIHRVIKLRPSCKTIQVSHFLEKPEDNRSWSLTSHRGEQRPVTKAPHTFITVAEWPNYAEPGDYVWRFVIRWRVNPLKTQQAIYRTPFTVR